MNLFFYEWVGNPMDILDSSTMGNSPFGTNINLFSIYQEMGKSIRWNILKFSGKILQPLAKFKFDLSTG